MITKEELRLIVDNSRLAFTEADLDGFHQKVNETIEMVSIISEVDLMDVEPMFYPNEQQYSFRNPELEFITDREELLANTKESEEGYFKFPSVLKGE